ncbi:Partial AB-hydrolase lipase domain,Alpha/Beta hydrolase fold [Cinara cedri]|uniref:Partial AB-hydrolase lipase domain,Alpha/Beta hydrolase fold n=1 Tax=Cinara cedri TaxID=506608 RepID=A0A5E4M3K8_9HEMI|nr:Partial AB-hydrolase lipase domain,Alpha/Beta hydrolase fold [Cinara cedri]
MSIFENVSLSTVEMLHNNGYASEVHKVVTKDGYVLELHRIPRSKCGQNPTRNHPVFIHHGILGSSADWVLGGADKSLPMQLADAGYDVWMANCRGNTYSRNHVTLNYHQKAFWNFSLQEIGLYDLPAAFDYVLMETNTTQLHYIGFSMGTSVFFIMASERPEYQKKIRSQISLAPVAYLSNTRSSLRFIAPMAKMMNYMFQRMSKGMLMPQSRMQTFLASTLCRERYTQKLICEKCIIFSVCGSDPYEFDSKLIPLIMGHFPAGTSSKLTAHFAQFILKDSFGQFDYGPTLNLLHYNSTEPPTYNLKSIKVPITLIYGKNDILADVKDVMRLKVQLPQLMDAIQVNSPYCNHVDLLWSLNVNEQVNNPVKEILQKTDRMDWSYSGPNPSATVVQESNSVGNHRNTDKTVNLLSDPKNTVRLVTGLDFFAENLDTIIASTMPQLLNETDAADFEREQELQKILFGNMINFFKSTGTKYGKLREDFTNEITDWTDDMTTGVLTEVANTQNIVETHIQNTQIMIDNQVNVVVDAVSKTENIVVSSANVAENVIVDGISKTKNTVTSSVDKAENFIVNGVRNAENLVVTGVGKAEHFVVTGVGKAENFVTNGVNKAEQSVVDGMVKAENLVNSGLNKANQAVGSTLDTTFRSLNKAFWFLK